MILCHPLDVSRYLENHITRRSLFDVLASHGFP